MAATPRASPLPTPPTLSQPEPLQDEFVYQTAWRATVLTAGVVITGLVAAVVVAGMRYRAGQLWRRR